VTRSTRGTVGLVVAVALGCGPEEAPGVTEEVAPSEVATCASCHEAIVGTYLKTAHYLTSAEADSQSIVGSFEPGRNELRTGSDSVYFRMERWGNGYFQTGFDLRHGGGTRTEPFSLAFGSGRRGKTYLYWKDGLLFELPVSYLRAAGTWVNSPGYRDGQVDFDRPVPPRCLECHATSFTLEEDRGSARYADEYQLGITCVRCHGDGAAHVAYREARSGGGTIEDDPIVNPDRLPLDRGLDVCALCHGGGLELLSPPFTFQPGDSLLTHFLPPADPPDLVPDVHGDQIGLLRRSPCFRGSAGMSCWTCHDVHRPQRDLAGFADTCRSCHDVSGHPAADRLGARLTTDCVDCHMPNRPSRSLQINMPGRGEVIWFRSHLIGVHPESRARLREAGPTPN